MKLFNNIGTILIMAMVAIIFLKGKKLFASTGLFSNVKSNLGEPQKENAFGALSGNGKVYDDPNNDSSSIGNGTHDSEIVMKQADDLHRYMLGIGTDEVGIIAIIEGTSSEADLNALIAAFALRSETMFGMTVFVGDLVAWLKAELSGVYLQRVKEIFENYELWR